jgi:hypothetical protein
VTRRILALAARQSAVFMIQSQIIGQFDAADRAAESLVRRRDADTVK